MLRTVWRVVGGLFFVLMGVAGAAALTIIGASFFKPDLPNQLILRSATIALSAFLITMALTLAFGYLRSRFTLRSGTRERNAPRWINNLCGLLAFAAMMQFLYVQFGTPGIGFRFDGDGWEAGNRGHWQAVMRVDVLSICWLHIRAMSTLILVVAIHELAGLFGGGEKGDLGQDCSKK